MQKFAFYYFQSINGTNVTIAHSLSSDLIPVLIPGATEFKERNQVQIFSTIKLIEISEVTLIIHIAHPFITP